jgi:MFS family permease
MTTFNRDASTSRVAWLPALLLIGAQCAVGMRDMAQTSFFLIYLQEQLNFAPNVISNIVAGTQIVGMVVALLGGAIAARIGSKWTLLIGMLISSIGSFAFQLHSLWLIVLIWLIGGGSGSLLFVGSSSYLTKLRTHGALGTLAAVYALSMTVGGAIGNPLAAAIIERYSYGGYGLFMFGFMVLVALLLAWWMPNIKSAPTEGEASQSSGNPLHLLRLPNFPLIIFMRGIPTLYYGMILLLVPLMLNQLSSDKWVIAAYGTANLIVASMAQLAAGRAADKWGALRPSIAGYAGIIVTGIGLSLSTSSVIGLFICGVLGIAAAWGLSTMLYMWVSDGIAKEQHASAFGLLHAVWSLSMVGGSLLGGQLVDVWPGLPFLLLGLVNVNGFWLVTMYYRRLARSAAASAATAG